MIAVYSARTSSLQAGFDRKIPFLFADFPSRLLSSPASSSSSFSSSSFFFSSVQKRKFWQQCYRTGRRRVNKTFFFQFSFSLRLTPDGWMVRWQKNGSTHSSNKNSSSSSSKSNKRPLHCYSSSIASCCMHRYCQRCRITAQFRWWRKKHNNCYISHTSTSSSNVVIAGDGAEAVEGMEVEEEEKQNSTSRDALSPTTFSLQALVFLLYPLFPWKSLDT